MTDGSSLAAGTLSTNRAEWVLSRIRAAIRAGVDWVQIREKNLVGRELVVLAREAVNLAAQSGAKDTRVIVNDRLDVALASGASGVHLGGESLPVREVVRWCRANNAPSDFFVGVSCHSLEQAREAESAGADYVFLGPLFDTPSKRSFGPPQGVAKLAEVCRAMKTAVIAIGGVNATNAVECFAAGAAGIAAIRLFQDAHDPLKLRGEIERLHAAG